MKLPWVPVLWMRDATGRRWGNEQVTGLIAVLFLLVGLHVPKAFTILYLALLVCLLQVRQYQQSECAARPTYWRWSFVCLLLFSLAYLGFNLYWGFTSLDGRALFDCISALVLPAGCFWVGLRLPALGRGHATKVLLAYAFGALLYVISALLVARHPWWAANQIFTSEIATPWGLPRLVDVRSIEQNGILALTMLPAALLLALKPAISTRAGSIVIGVSCLLALHVVLSLNGRLGFLALLLALLPLLPAAWHSRRHCSKWFTAVGLGGMVFIGAVIWRHPSFQRLLAEDFCDERFGLYAGFLQLLSQGLLGGRRIVFASLLCDGKTPFGFGGAAPGALKAVHNIVLDIYNDSGFLPVLLLLLALIPPLLMILRGFWRLSVMGLWDWQWAVRWSWFVVLSTQWLFSPLLYGDGLLYYLSFLVLGLLSSEFAHLFSAKSRSALVFEAS